MNVGMPQYGMPSGASSGSPYFNGWSPYGGFGQPQQSYGMSSPFGGLGGGYGMSSPFGGFRGGYGMPFQQIPMGGGKGGYSSPFGQFQTPNFAAKGGDTQLQSPPSPGDFNSLQSQQSNLPPGSGLPPGAIGQIPGNQPQQPATGLPQPPLTGSMGTASPTTGIVGAPLLSPSPSRRAYQPTPPVPQAVPPQMMNPVSGPVQMGPGMQPTGMLPQQTFNQNRLPGANPISPTRNMLIGGYR